MNVWGVSGIKFQKSNYCGSDFLQVVEAMVDKCDKDEFVLFVGIARKIWYRRIMVVHDGEFLHQNSTVKEAFKSVEDFKRANLSETVRPTENRSTIQSRWKAPTELHYKVNCDAVIDKFSG
jgi:hypothetical protein